MGKNSIIKFSTFVIMPLIVGVLLYAFTRENNPYFLSVFNVNFQKIETANWVKYNLPDGLWAFSFTSLIILIWGNERTTYFYVWLIITLLAIIGFEIFLGVFDLLDLLFILSGFTISFIILNKTNLLTKITEK
ncbi:MAG: hypothetical protein WBA59_09665 [Moheibacter sp.]